MSRWYKVIYAIDRWLVKHPAVDDVLEGIVTGCNNHPRLILLCIVVAVVLCVF